MPRDFKEQSTNIPQQETTGPTGDIASLSLPEQSQWILDNNEGMSPHAAEMLVNVMFNHLRNNQIPKILRSHDPVPTDEEVWKILVTDPDPLSLFKIHGYEKYEIQDFFKSWMKQIRQDYLL